MHILKEMLFLFNNNSINNNDNEIIIVNNDIDNNDNYIENDDNDNNNDNTNGPVKIHSFPYETRTHNLYGTKSPSNARRARYPLHHLAVPKKGRLKGELISAPVLHYTRL